MKKLKYIAVQLMVCCLLFSGCDKYLDITPKGRTLLLTTAHYDQWLNQESLIQGVSAGNGNLISYLTDNVDYATISTPPGSTPGELVYTWAPQFSVSLTDAPLFWGEHYSKINLFNTVVGGVEKADGPTSQKKSLKAEALLGRSLEYFYLMNLYCQLYDPATAAQNPGVPYVTSDDVSQATPPRGTLAEIFQHVIDDINAAIPDLPVDNSANRFRGSVAGAYSLLARVYFYAGNYEAARTNAELALANTKAVMINYNGPLPTTSQLNLHPDVIYGRYMIGNMPASLPLMRSFTANDLRPKTLYTSSDGYTYSTRGATSFVPRNITVVLGNTNTGTSVQEMKLIAAEAAARANDLSAALQYLDDVRKNRTNSTYVKYTSTVQEDVLQQILLERNHELPFNGLRWFDMRRLDKENRMGTVTRTNAAGTVLATLAPHSPNYTLQIPYQVMSFNSDWQQNP